MTDLRFATIPLATGLRLDYAEQGDPGGAPVLLLHGWPDSWFTFSRVLPLLSRRLRVVVPDRRGFGDSEKPVLGYAIEDFAADAVALLDALSIERATIVGHSFGSFVGRQVAIAHPERTDRVVLIGTGVSAGSPVVREVQAGVRDLQDPVPLEFARDFQAGTAYLPLPAAFFDRVVAESLKLPARLWRAALDAVIAYDDSGARARITAPTLLVWGDHDALFPREDQDRLRSEIPNARLSVLAETGHCPNWERPERVAEELEAFVR
jgi:pimeloyl-ACP methyl ester carboxylesterase